MNKLFTALKVLCSFFIIFPPLTFAHPGVLGSVHISDIDVPEWQQLPAPNQIDLSKNTSTAILKSLHVLDTYYFKLWPGIWPTGIDWTSAVVGTYVAEILSTFSSSLSGLTTPKKYENLINRYFSHLTALFFGQDISGLRQQANDDMLWVVLEWLRGIKFIHQHSSLFNSNPQTGEWYGKEWIQPFAHRARIFWELASQGWNTTLCDGGMIWNSKLLPYKNAITNELYISGSIAMYLYFPGDQDSSSFGNSTSNSSLTNSPSISRDPKYLVAAIDAYKWLINSNMTNEQGLFVDGFHILGLGSGLSNNTKCDERNEMVYTYNQGVLLSGQYGLYQATGARSYLEEGHQLVANVIAATGWDLSNNKSYDPIPDNPHDTRFGKWHGLGRYGVLEEICDSSATCSQDSQTFKGIYFLHLTYFCAPLLYSLPGAEIASTDDFEETKQWHKKKCQQYVPWIRHNADAALKTLDSKGRFGAWWNIPADTNTSRIEIFDSQMPPGEVDYRNFGVPMSWAVGNNKRHQARQEQINLHHDNITIPPSSPSSLPPPPSSDLNDRGRGRTLETQFGGVSVIRALWEIGGGQ